MNKEKKMALIKCPNCGGEISDKAEICPKCSFVLKEPIKIVCSECGSEVPEGATSCPNCGNPIIAPKPDEVQKVEVSKITVPNIKLDKKLLWGILGTVVLIVGIVFAVSSNKEKQYFKNYKKAVSTMLNGGVEAENVCNDIVKVWSNSINHKFDPETNQYTLKSDYRLYYSKESGSATSSQRKCFNDDFNTSLALYFADSDYNASSLIIEENKKTVNDLMSKLSKVPKGLENTYSAIDSLYDEYLTFTEMALNPTGSLTSFSSAFHEVDNDFIANYNKAKNFADNFGK